MNQPVEKSGDQENLPPNNMDGRADEDPQAPSINSVYRFLMYGVSLPERALRSSSAMIGGVLQKSSELLVPQAFRSSKSYSIFVTQMLDILTENVGGVEKPKEEGDEEAREPKATEVENYVARKAVGNFVDLAGFATLHLSPMTLLAIVSDVAYGSQTYLKELAIELKREGVISEDSTINNATDLLEAVSDASGTTAQAFDMPPLSVDGLKNTISETRQAVGKIDPSKLIPQAEIAKLWNDMREMANREQVNLFEISSAMTLYTLNQVTTVGKGALSTIRVAGTMVDRHIFNHYFDSIRDIREKGLYASIAESAKPYMDAVWNNFSTEKETWTEDLLTGRMIGRAWEGFTGWFSRKATEPNAKIDAGESEPAVNENEKT